MRYSIIILLVLLSSIGYAQDKRSSGGTGHFYFGYAHVNNEVLNQFLPSTEAELGRSYTLIGGSGYFIIKGIMIGGSGEAIQLPKTEGDSVTLTGAVGTGFLKLGYLVIDKPRWKLFPAIGIGGGGATFNIARNQDVDFDKINDPLQLPSQEITLKQANWMFDFGLGVDYLIPSKKKEYEDHQSGGWLLGLRMGYIYSLQNNNWEFNGGEINNAPEYAPNIFYVKLSIGIGGFTTKPKEDKLKRKEAK